MEKYDGEPKMDLLSFMETEHRQLLRATEVAKMLGVSLETIYDWKYRSKIRRIPEGMFLKVSRMLFVRSDLLKQWIAFRPEV